jgi:hypothetical protein
MDLSTSLTTVVNSKVPADKGLSSAMTKSQVPAMEEVVGWGASQQNTKGRIEA